MEQPDEAPESVDTPSADVVGQLAAAEDAELRRSLAALSQLAMSQVPLPEMLTHVAEFAVQAIPGADGAGLTLLDGERPESVVASADFVDRVDDIQYRLGEGPCVTAAAQRRMVRCGSLSDDPTWPRFGPTVGMLGVHSALSLPLTFGDEVVAAMNVYARARDAFDERAEELARLYGVAAAVSVRNARELERARTLAGQLEAALRSRGIIDQAIGILISRTGCSEAEAFVKLRTISQRQNRKLSAVAMQLRDEAAHRARAVRRRDD